MSGGTGRALRDKTQNYIISEARSVPLTFCRDGYFRVAADTECRSCGKRVVCILRAHRWRSEFGLAMIAAKAPDPSSERVASSIALRTEERRTGVPDMHHRGCRVGQIKRTGRMMLAGMSRRDH